MSNKASYGSTVRITNKYDRLFFEHTGIITQMMSRAQVDGPLETNYYVQASDIPCGRWFSRNEFEVVGTQEGVTP